MPEELGDLFVPESASVMNALGVLLSSGSGVLALVTQPRLFVLGPVDGTGRTFGVRVALN